jgi:8-oxo-dGTP pyrophosphatase MutT (NUDIX family)
MTENSRISEPTSGQIESAARAIIVDDEKILLCRPIDRDFYFLPGGHIEFGETALETLRREIVEELGVTARDVKPIGFVDNIYESGRFGFKRHEINLLYEAKLVTNEIKPTEEHIEFRWVEIVNLSKEKILPLAVKEAVIKRLSNGAIVA